MRVIIGREILAINTEISTTILINSTAEDKTKIEIPLQIVFDEYNLFIYNKWNVISLTMKSLTDLKGEKVVDLKHHSKILHIWFNNQDSIEVDLSDDGYIGLEAMVLHGPDNLIVVWN